MEVSGGSATTAAMAGVATAIVSYLIAGARIRGVDGVTAISKAYERVLAGHDAQVELLKSLVGEQGKRIDTLQALVGDKDSALADRDSVIRRLREHLDVYYHALIEARIDVPRPPDVAAAPERRRPATVELAQPVVDAARHDASTPEPA